AEQRRDEVPAEEEEHGDPEAARDDALEPGVRREDDEERDGTEAVERREVTPRRCRGFAHFAPSSWCAGSRGRSMSPRMGRPTRRSICHRSTSRPARRSATTATMIAPKTAATKADNRTSGTLGLAARLGTFAGVRTL